MHSQLIKKYLKKYRYTLLTGVIFVIATNLFVLLIPRTFKTAIDAIRDHQPAQLTHAVGLILLFALLGGFSRFMMRNSLFTAGRNIEQDIRNDLFEQLLRLPQSYYQQMKTGDILSRALNDMDNIRYLFGHVTMHIANIISLYLFAIISLASLNLRLTLLAILPFPVLFGITRYYSRIFFNQYKEVMEKMSAITISLQEIFSSIIMIKAYARERQVRNRFVRANHDYVKTNMKLVRTGSIYHPFISLFTSMSALIILWMGGIQVIKGQMSLGAFVAFNGTLIYLVQPTVFIGWVVNLFQRSRASVARIEEIIYYPDIIQDSPQVDKSIHNLLGKLSVKSLNFAYAANQSDTLRDISFQVRPGQIIALIGEVGSGKSTLLQTIQRIYNPPQQTVFFDQHELYTIPLELLYRRSAYVSQEPLIFSGTIRANIAYFNPDVPEQDIINAARFAAIEKDILAFEHGYDTIVGEHGITLSGGQKQRLAIARAIIKHPRYLFIDNALSAVDTETEEEILNNLIKRNTTMTTLIVGHRISTLKHCDKILLLDQGQIVASGTHEQLLQNNARYQEIYEKQKS